MEDKTIDKRDYLFDNLKALLIFLVVFGHCIERYISDSNLLKFLYFFIYLFHMPLFIFVSGYFSKNTKKSIRSSLNSLVIPYILFSITWCIFIYILEGKFKFSLITPSWTLWYLVSLFCWRISLKYLIKIKYIIPLSVLLALFMGVIGIRDFSLSRTFAFLPFFLLGYYSNEDTIKRIKRIKPKYCILALTTVFLISMYIIFNFDINVKFLYNLRSYSDFNLGFSVGVFLKALIFTIATVLSVSIIRLVPTNKTFYSYIGRNSLTVYLLHIYPIKILYILIPNFGNNFLLDTIILSSGLFITFFLSSNTINKLYTNTFGRIKIKDSNQYKKKST